LDEFFGCCFLLSEVGQGQDEIKEFRDDLLGERLHVIEVGAYVVLVLVAEVDEPRVWDVCCLHQSLSML